MPGLDVMEMAGQTRGAPWPAKLFRLGQIFSCYLSLPCRLPFLHVMQGQGDVLNTNKRGLGLQRPDESCSLRSDLKSMS